MSVSNTLSSQKANSSNFAWKRKLFPRKLASMVIMVTLLFSVVDLASAQTRPRRWIYTSTSGENAKLYYREDIKKISPNRRRGWVKMIFPDKSFAIASQIWNCKLSMSKTTRITMYDKRGVVTGKPKGLDWQEVIPDSINETLLLRVCGIQKDNTWLEIITKNANLRSFKTRYSMILRRGKKGERFRVINFAPNSIWFNIVDEKTQQDYWIHRTTVKIIKPRNREIRRKVGRDYE